MANEILAREQSATRIRHESSAPISRLDERYLADYELGRFRIARQNNILLPPDQTLEQNRRWDRNTLKANLGMIDGFEYFGGLNVAEPGRFDWMTEEVVEFSLLPVYNVKYAIMENEDTFGLTDARLIDRFEGAALVELESVYPRAYWVKRCYEVKNRDELVQAIEVNNFSDAVLLEALGESQPDCVPGAEAVTGSGIVPAEILEYTPNRVHLQVSAPIAGWLVVNDLYYPGWRAEMDGAPTEIYRANGLVRAVKLSAGEHEVNFIYRPRELMRGIIISSLSFIFCAAAITVERMRQRQKKEPRQDCRGH